MGDKLLNIFKSGRNSHQIKLYYRWLLEILSNLKMIFPQNIIQNNSSFSPEEEVEFQVNLEEMMHKRIIRDTTYKFTEFVSPTFIIKNLDGRIQLILNLKEMN